MVIIIISVSLMLTVALLGFNLLSVNSDVFDISVQFQKHVECLLKHKTVHVQSDRGGGSITTSTPSFSRLGSLTV